MSGQSRVLQFSLVNTLEPHRAKLTVVGAEAECLDKEKEKFQGRWSSKYGCPCDDSESGSMCPWIFCPCCLPCTLAQAVAIASGGGAFICVGIFGVFLLSSLFMNLSASDPNNVGLATVAAVVSVTAGTVAFLALFLARIRMRQNYNIPQRCFLEDLCCALYCQSCTIFQIFSQEGIVSTFWRATVPPCGAAYKGLLWPYTNYKSLRQTGDETPV